MELASSVWIQIQFCLQSQDCWWSRKEASRGGRGDNPSTFIFILIVQKPVGGKACDVLALVVCACVCISPVLPKQCDFYVSLVWPNPGWSVGPQESELTLTEDFLSSPISTISGPSLSQPTQKCLASMRMLISPKTTRKPTSYFKECSWPSLGKQEGVASPLR